MTASLVFDTLYAIAVVSAFCLFLVIGEALFDLAYAYIPAFTKWWDNYSESLPDWDEEEVV